MTYRFYLKKTMNKLLILLLLCSYPALGATVKAPVKPLKAFKKAQVKLSKPYIQSYPSSSVLVRVEPQSLPQGQKELKQQCQKYKLQCAIFPDSENKALLNVSVMGSSIDIKSLLAWTKKNSLVYKETQHQKK
jgi:hypothetical protein